MKWVKWGGLALVIVVAISWRADLRSKKELRDTAAEINLRAPITVGPGIRIDKADYSDKKFNIHYTITDMKASEVPVATANVEFKKLMVKIVCSNEAMRRAVKDQITFVSTWRGSDNQEITQVRVAEADCT